MGGADSECESYGNDDFEEEVEEALSLELEASEAPKEVPEALAPLPAQRARLSPPPLARPPLQEGCGAAVAPVDVMGGCGLADARTGSAGSMAGRRVVRGKVKVCGSNDDLSPYSPGVLPVAASSAKVAPAASGRPLWLQSEGSSAARHRDPFAIGGEVESSLVSREDRRKITGLAEDSGGRAGARRIVEDCDMSEHVGAGEDAERRVKRLQGEVQRLSQRLKETEMFSQQDEGLPVFTLEDVEVGMQIAQGGFASVHHARWHGTQCALKKIFDPVITEELKSEFENEVRMLRRLRHPNVVTLMAVCRKPPALSILTELVIGGSLFELLHSPPCAHHRVETPEQDPAVLLPILGEAGAAIAYLHAMLVVHRDVKSQNVLLTAGRRPTAKLCDFGLARMKSELCIGTMQWAGTPSYMAPELYLKRRYNEAVDTFAFGVMLWEVVSLELPHANLDPADICHRIQTKEAAGLALVHSWPKSLKNLLRKTLAAKAEDRPSMRSVLEQVAEVIDAFPAPD